MNGFIKRDRRKGEKHTSIPVRQLQNRTIQLPATEICSAAFAILAHFRCPMSRARVDGAIVLDAAGQYVDCTIRRVIL